MNSDLVLAAIIAAVPALAAALLSFVAMLFSRHARRSISQLHVQINSRFDELLRLTAEVARAKGFAEGSAMERGRSTLQVEVTGSMLKEKPPNAA